MNPHSLSGLQRIVADQLGRGKINDAASALNRWASSAAIDELQADTSSPRLRSVVCDVARAALAALDPLGPPTRFTGLHVSTSTLTTAAAIVGGLGEWKLALATMGHLPARGITPSGLAIAKTLRKGNAKHVLRWTEAHSVIMDPCVALRVLEQQGSWTEALDLARVFDRKSRRNERYSVGILVPYLANGGRWQAAVSVLGDAVRAGAALHPRLVRLIVEQCCNNPSSWHCALRLASYMSRLRLLDEHRGADADDMYLRLARVTPDWCASMRLCSVVCRGAGLRPTAELLSVALSRCEVHGRWEEASAIMNLAIKHRIVDAVESPACHKALLSSFASSAGWDRAVRAMGWMTAAGHAASEAGLNVLLTMCRSAGQWEATAAVGTLILNAHLAARSDSTSPPVGVLEPGEALRVYEAVIGACSASGLWANAAAVLVSMLRDDVIDAPPAAAAEIVIAATAKARAWMQALTQLTALRDVRPRIVVSNQCYAAVAKSAVDHARWSTALDVVRMLVDDARQGATASRSASKPSSKVSEASVTTPLIYAAISAAAFSGRWVVGAQLFSAVPAHSWLTFEGRTTAKRLIAAAPIEAQRALNRMASGQHRH